MIWRPFDMPQGWSELMISTPQNNIPMVVAETTWLVRYNERVASEGVSLLGSGSDRAFGLMVVVRALLATPRRLERRGRSRNCGGPIQRS